MAYADQQGMSTNRIISIVIVFLLHAFLGYALVTGLAYQAVTQLKQKITAVDVEEEKPPEEEPPPPPPEDFIEPPPQVITPPTPFTPPTPNKSSSSDDVEQKNTDTNNNFVCWDGAKVANAGLCRERPPEYKCWNGSIVKIASDCPPEVKKKPPTKPIPKGNTGNWANTNDYPSRALQQEREGTTGFTVNVGPDGRVTSCSVTSSSGHNDLDDATCKKVQSRGRFTPAMDGDGNPTSGTWSSRVRWEIPK